MTSPNNAPAIFLFMSQTSMLCNVSKPAAAKKFRVPVSWPGLSPWGPLPEAPSFPQAELPSMATKVENEIARKEYNEKGRRIPFEQEPAQGTGFA